MDWGDFPGWLACLGAAVAIWVSIKARSDGRESARQSKRSADAAHASLALQREEAEERRQAALPKVELTITKVSKNGYVLRNEGDLVAEDVTVVEGQAFRIVDRPEGVTLRKHESARFTMLGTFQTGQAPAHVLTTWAGQAEPVAIPIRE